MSAFHPTTCPLDCPDACGVLVESDDAGRFVRVRGNPEHSWSRGHLCGKTMLYGELVNHPRRLRTPLVRVGSKLVETTWDDALDRIAEKLGPLEGRSILALWYGGTMGLVQRKFPLRLMHALGATLHDGGVCDATSTAGYECVLGRCLGPDIEEVEHADLLVIWGADVARTVQHLQPPLARMQKRGVPVFAIDVWRTETIRHVEQHGGRGLVIRPGTDAALALCIARLAFELGFADREFLQRECAGADVFEAHVRAAQSVEETAAITGLAVDDVLDLARALQQARAPFIKTGVGWTRRRNGAMSMRAVCSLAAVLGHGDRVHYESFAHFALPENAIIRPDLRPASVSDATVKQVELGRLLDEGAFRAALVWCHDPAVTLPESARFKRGFARADLFTVVHDHFLTETAELADVVLPATMFVEHSDVYRSYGHRVMQYTRRPVAPPEGARSNVATFSAIARHLGLRPETWDVTDESVCEEFLEASRARLSDDELARLRTGVPVKLAPQSLTGWGTASGKIELWSDAEAAAGRAPMATYAPDECAAERGAFRLVSAPSVHTHNSTYAHSERHQKRAGAPRAHLNADDALALGVVDGAAVRIANDRAELTLPAAIDPHVPRGLVRVDGVPRASDIPERQGINALVSGDTSDLGDGNVLYSTRVDVYGARHFSSRLPQP